MRFRAFAVLSVSVAACLTPVGAASADGGPRPGAAGAPLVVDRDASYYGFDAATDAAGTTYVGWLSSHSSDDPGAELHLCVLPVGATDCEGGVQTTDALERLSAEQLFVVASGDSATLVWHHRNGPDDTDDPMQDRIATAQVVDGVLQPGVDVAQVPSHTTLMAVDDGPRGISAALISGPDDEARTIYHYDTLTSAPTTLRTRFSVGNVELADDGRTTVLLADQYAAVAKPVQVAWKPSGGGAWSDLTAVRGTRTDHGTARLATSERGIRLLATAKNRKQGGDQTVVAAWSGGRHAFSQPAPALPGQSCTTEGRDVTTDASGRLASVAIGCDTLAVGNHQTGGVGALTELGVDLTVTDTDAQITTTPSGHGWVAWVATRRQGLTLRPIQLPALTRTTTATTRAGRVRVTAPVSCLPTVRTPVGVRAAGAHGWQVARADLYLGPSKVGRTIDGSSLEPGRSYSLRAEVRFRRQATTKDWSKTFEFTTCGRP